MHIPTHYATLASETGSNLGNMKAFSHLPTTTGRHRLACTPSLPHFRCCPSTSHLHKTCRFRSTKSIIIIPRAVSEDNNDKSTSSTKPEDGDTSPPSSSSSSSSSHSPIPARSDPTSTTTSRRRNPNNNNNNNNSSSSFWHWFSSKLGFPSKKNNNNNNTNNRGGGTKLSKPQEFARFLINVTFFFFLMRLWPIPPAVLTSAGAGTGIGISAQTNEKGETVNAAVPRQQTSGPPVTLSVPYSKFVSHVKNNQIDAVIVDGSSLIYSVKPKSPAYLEIQNTLRRSSGSSSSSAATTTTAPYQRVLLQTTRPADISTPYDVLFKNNVMVSANIDKRAMRGLNLMTFAIGFLLLASVMKKLPWKLGGGKGTGRRHMQNNSKDGGPGAAAATTFDDVAGVDEAKEELREVVDFLKFPEKFSALGARPPSGVLLTGPPGTGKTLLARAVAGEAGVPFFSISASEFVELYVGMGASRVRELFANARKEAPAIVFIDEIDAVAKGRDSRLRSVGNDEREQTLNQLLTELDGFDQHKGALVICIAATNRPDVLDSALLRPGRFDRRVSVERPDRKGRERILTVHIAKRELPLADDVKIDRIAAATTGFTGADLANLVNEAALLAGREDKSAVGALDFDAAIVRQVAGIEKKGAVLAAVEKSVVARHEVGHALVSTAVASVLPAAMSSPAVEKLSIIPRSGGALGFTYIPPANEDRALLFDAEIRGQLAMLMGGRAAEELFCGFISTGASDDLRRATDLARRAVSDWGLSQIVGPMSVGILTGGNPEDEFGGLLKDGSGKTAQLAENEARKLLETALQVAKDVLNENKGLHKKLSSQLEGEERMEGDVLRGALTGVAVPESLREFILQGKVVD